MISKRFKLSSLVLAPLLGFSMAALTLAQTSVDGNSERSLDREYSELTRLHEAFTVTHAAALDSIAKADMDPQFAQVRAKLRHQLERSQDTDEIAHSMVQGSDPSDPPNTDMNGAYYALDVQVRVEMARMLRGEHTGTAAAEAYNDAAALPHDAAIVLAAGRKFKKQLWDLWVDPDTSAKAKEQATRAAIEHYQTGDSVHAVSAQPKPVSLYLNHAYAGALKRAYPRISGLLWSNQWLQLASLEAIIRGQVDPQFEGSFVDTLRGYYNKLGSDSGMSMFPSPVEMPNVPTIAPTLYTLAPEASIIIDNLNMLDAAITDIIAYPDLDASTRKQAIEEKVAQFIAEENATDEINYLLSALRGGIYNQGGPAIGELTGSERNFTRAAISTQHYISISAPN